MAQIEVNHQTLRDLASAIADYCDAQNQQMRKADIEMQNMFRIGYQGQDALVLKGKWEAVNAPESTTIRFRDSLKSYAAALSAAADAYRTAQESAYNEAKWLPKYLYW